MESAPHSPMSCVDESSDLSTSETTFIIVDDSDAEPAARAFGAGGRARSAAAKPAAPAAAADAQMGAAEDGDDGGGSSPFGAGAGWSLVEPASAPAPAADDDAAGGVDAAADWALAIGGGGGSGADADATSGSTVVGTAFGPVVVHNAAGRTAGVSSILGGRYLGGGVSRERAAPPPLRARGVVGLSNLGACARWVGG